MSKSEYEGKEKILLESFGGNGGLVTGSCHKLQIRDTRVMVDLGLFQGLEERSKRGEQRNLGLKDIDFRGVSDVLLTHSHIDHCGRLPLAFKKGFRFNIYATEATASLAEVMLLDSAKIQEDQPINKRLYERKDVDLTLRHLKGVPVFSRCNIGQKYSGITAEFLSNGHILGAASILIRDEKNPHHLRNILFSGDIGKPIQSLSGGYTDFVDRYPSEPIHAMVLESTNFEKTAVAFENKEKELLFTFEKVWRRGGNVLMPVLSLHRLQEIMEMLHNFQNEGKIPSDCEIIVDAPLGMRLTSVYEDLAEDNFLMRYGGDENFYKANEESVTRFNLKNLTIVGSHDESVAMDKKMAGSFKRAIILASGGMFDVGRSMNYRKGDFCKNPKNAVLFTCFQVNGTFGSRLLFAEKDKELSQDRRTHDKKGKLIGAQVFSVEGFSSHASGLELIDFVERFNLNELQLVDIGHGKDSSRMKMAEVLKSRGYSADIVTPKEKEKMEIYLT